MRWCERRWTNTLKRKRPQNNDSLTGTLIHSYKRTRMSVHTSTLLRVYMHTRESVYVLTLRHFYTLTPGQAYVWTW